MTTEIWIARIINRLVEFQDEFAHLYVNGRMWVIQNPKEAIGLFVEAVKNHIAVLTPVVKCTTLAAVNGKFFSDKMFKVNTEANAAVKISYMSHAFRYHFGSIIEGPFPGSVMEGRQLCKDSSDDTILQELGGPKKVAVTNRELFAMLILQPDGEEGQLATDGSTNAFYLINVNGTLCRVNVTSHPRGWRLCETTVDDPRGLDAGCWIFYSQPRQT